MDYIDKVVSGVNKMEFVQFVKMEDELSSIDEDMMRAWHLRSFYWQMIDVWYSVDIAKWLWRRWQKTKEDGDYTLFINKMRRFIICVALFELILIIRMVQNGNFMTFSFGATISRIA